MKHFKSLIGIMILSLMLIPSVSFAQGGQKGIHEPGTGLKNSELKEGNQGTGQGLKAKDGNSLQNQGEEQGNQVRSKEDKASSTGQKSTNKKNKDSEDEGLQQGKGANQTSDRAKERKNKVASAVQQMLQVAERNQGVGEQIRTIAQTQNQEQEQIEAGIEQVKNRGQLKKFFFGPDYKALNSVEDRLATHTEKLEQLKELTSQITNEADVEVLEEQIATMEQIKSELEEEIEGESSGFSLLGWLNKMLVN